MISFKGIFTSLAAAAAVFAAPAAAFRVQLLCTDPRTGATQLACVDLGDSTGQTAIEDVLALLTTSSTECFDPNGGLLANIYLPAVIETFQLNLLCSNQLASTAGMRDPTAQDCLLTLSDGTTNDCDPNALIDILPPSNRRRRPRGLLATN